jgi:three-Cys-motif partner protein
MKQLELFDLPKTQERYRYVFGGLRRPIWTENKARMIEIYLRLFVYITKHGAYIDGFSGPQKIAHPDAWTAKLVLNSEPKRLRQIFLCELKEKKLKPLRSLVRKVLRDDAKSKIKRKIKVFEGDFQLEDNRHSVFGRSSRKNSNILPS